MLDEVSILRSLSNKEKQLIQFIRELGWGDMKIRVENGQPVLIYEAIKTIKLEDKPLNQGSTHKKAKDVLNR
ncbi:MAG: hypothetical protein ACOY4I_03990 [Bacillota bacterium]